MLEVYLFWVQSYIVPTMKTAAPASDTVRTNLRLARVSRGLSVRAVSRLLADRGHPLAPSAISKIELGHRRIDVDDVAAFAAIYDVSVLDLFAPPSIEGFVPIPTDLAEALEELAAADGAMRMAMLHQERLDALVKAASHTAERARRVLADADLPSTRRPDVAPSAANGSSTTTSKGASDGIHRQDRSTERSD